MNGVVLRNMRMVWSEVCRVERYPTPGVDGDSERSMHDRELCCHALGPTEFIIACFILTECIHSFSFLQQNCQNVGQVLTIVSVKFVKFINF